MAVVPIEQKLVERSIAADPRAFRSIYERHSPAVYRFLRDLLGNDAAADEATQETFVRAHRALASLRDMDRLLPWLLGIARNVFRETVRARRAIPVEDDELDENPMDAPSPEAQLLGREADEVLARALEQLSPDRRAALLLLMDHDLSYADIAATMSWSLAKTKVEIHRARQKLRAIVSDYLGGNA